MKSLRIAPRVLLPAPVAALVFYAALRCDAAQANLWTAPASGNWHDQSWSLGVLPGPGQTVHIVNPGYKTVAVSPETARLFPQTLEVERLTVGAPAGDANTLLIAGLTNDALVASNALQVGTNALLTIVDSSLRVGGPNESTFSIGGRFTQGGASSVEANQMDIGYTGAGTYTLTNGSLAANHLYLGGPFAGFVEQQAGTVEIGILHLGPQGTFRLNGGDYRGTIYFDGGHFLQNGGRFHDEINVYRGSFELAGGDFLAPMGVPDFYGAAAIVQTGGTNLAPRIRVGDYSDGGTGTYTLSNGFIRTPDTSIRFNGTFHQWGGVHIIEGPLTVEGALINRGMVGAARYNLHQGVLESPSLNLVFGYFGQTGGTNAVGHLTLAPSYETFFTLSGGVLHTHSTTVLSSSTGGFLQTGGSHAISNTLSIDRGSSLFRGYTLEAGELAVSNIIVNPSAALRLKGGTIQQTGALVLRGGSVELGSVAASLGGLQLQAASGAEHSFLGFGSEAAAARFQDSRLVAWDASAWLHVRNWAGSPAGAGYHQLSFGANGSGLNSQQVAQIRFEDPAGFAPGMYPARLLPSGEVVPEGLPPVGHIRPVLTGELLATGSFRLALRGEVGARYAVEVSTNLTTWVSWTNAVTSSSGWLIVDDTAAASVPSRTYRAVLLR